MQDQHKSLTEDDNMMAPYLRQKIFLLPQGERSLSQTTDHGFFLRKNLQDLASKAKIDLTDKLGQLQKNLYVANAMYLVIWAPDNLDSLARLAIDNFSTMPSATNPGMTETKKETKLTVRYLKLRVINERNNSSDNLIRNFKFSRQSTSPKNAKLEWR